MLSKTVLLCFFNCLYLQAEADTQCDEFTMDIVDIQDFSNFNPINNSITYIHTTAKELSTCDYLRVYVELEEPLPGLTRAKANFTLKLEHTSKGSLVSLENHVDGGLIAGIIIGLLLLIIGGYFVYNIVMEKLKSGVYRLPPTTETMQFKAL
ncbi:unnamed protein product [Pieris brassicae]|uniref:Uncharacterized protein n=1 Tax=Pieris brassicae TaxID=7116 RepID=A0A9P0XCY8_PIEBR|nr:unnamed protein product [Pieris brassicae]